MNEIETVRQEVIPIPEYARLIIVKDQSSLEEANRFFLDIKALRKKIASVFDPIISKAHAAHAEALEQKKQAEAPLIVAEKYLNTQVTDYKREQDRIRAEEEERLRQQAIKEEMEKRRKEEDERLAQAAELERVGAHIEAGAIIAEAIMESVRPVEPYIPPPATPKVELNGASIRLTYSAKVTDMKKLIMAVAEGKAPSNCLEANMVVLNGLARSLKKELKIDGVEVVETRSLAATGRNRMG